MPWEDKIKAISGLLLLYSKMKEFVQNGSLPPSKFNALDPGTKLSYQFRNGKILPTFEVKTLFEAIELTFFLTSELKQIEY